MRARVRRTDDRGASAVEFALVVPLLLVLVFGIINFGVLFSQQLTMNNGVREGARRAVVADPNAPRSCAEIITSVRNELVALALDPNDVDVQITTDGFTSTEPCPGGFVSSYGTGADNVPCKGSYNDGDAGSLVVEARHESGILVSFPPFPTSLTLTSKAVYRCEFST